MEASILARGEERDIEHDRCQCCIPAQEAADKTVTAGASTSGYRVVQLHG